MVALSCGREIFWLICSAVTFSIVLSQKPSITIIYNSKGEHDGDLQKSLFRGAFLGLMEADTESTFQPIFLDLSLNNLTEGHPNKNVEKNETTKIFTPRNLERSKLKSVLKLNRQLLVFSLEMKEETRVTALLNRISKVKTRVLTPVLDDESQLSLLKLYQTIALKLYSVHQIKFQKPIFMSHSTSSSNSHLLSSLSHSTPSQNTNKTQLGKGILLLSRKWFPDPEYGFWSEEHFFRWFSHTPIHETKKGTNILFGMYTTQYIGSSNWNTALRRNVIRDISNFSDPTPTILSTILAFDTATVAATYAKGDKLPRTFSGLSGDINFDVDGFRAGDVVCIGISALSSIESSYAMLLQNSSWILEDIIHLRLNQTTELFEIVDYQVGTSSLLTQKELLNVAKESEKEGHGTCIEMSLEVTTHDPFTQLPYRYFFSKNNLPTNLLVPNQFGYGLKFLCETMDTIENRMEIACTPREIGIATTVHCFQSKLRVRNRRSPMPNSNSRFHYPVYSNQRDDTVNSFSLPNKISAYMGGAFMSTTTASPGSMTTMEETTPMEPETSPAPTPKLPDLRGILKNTKPFVGGCIGATTGCSVCVVVLGRLPLGTLPAACTGPCFVTTFANCGALLGRTFAETTVICTELFRQGYLDIETFLVDAEFGNQLANEAPLTLRGYQRLASPFVEQMRTSEMITKIVNVFASPWAEYMKYLMGRTKKYNLIGYVVHNFGIVICETYGRFFALWEKNPTDFFNIVVLTLLGILLLGIINFKWIRKTCFFFKNLYH